MSEGEQSHQDPEQGTSSLKLGRVAVIRILVAVCIIAPAVIWIEHKLAKPRQIPYWNCLSNIKRTIAAINLYQADWDDRIPNGDWIPKIVAASKYKGNDHVFGCPSVVNENPAAYGYALSRWVAGKDVDNVSTPELTALLFDSSILSRSAISDFSTVPSPPRHNEMNYFGFVDGHAESGQTILAIAYHPRSGFEVALPGNSQRDSTDSELQAAETSLREDTISA